MSVILGELKMRKILVVVIMSVSFLSSCMSNYEEFEERKPMSAFSESGPYAIKISGYNPAAQELLEVYVQSTFGKSLTFSENSKSSFNFTFISEPTTNPLATWRDGTAFVSIKDKKGQLLWAGEYNYKGGNEMSGFSVRTDIEAAKLTLGRLYKEFIRK